MVDKKILFHIKDPHGGTGRFIEQVTEMISQHTPWQTKVIIHHQARGFRIKAKRIGYPIQKQATFRPSDILRTIINLLLYLRELKQFRPDTVIAFDLYAIIINVIIHRFNPKPYLITCTHINLLYHIKNGRKYWWSAMLFYVIRKVYPFSDIHLVPSQELKNQLITTFKLKQDTIQVIPNPINISSIREYSKEAASQKYLNNFLKQEKTFKIFTMGRFDRQKYFQNIFKAVSKLKSKKLNIVLYVLGKGKLVNEYKKIIDHLNITKNVVFLGWQSNPFKYLRYANVFVLISKYECFPYSILEAMCLNIPIISSNVDFGPREILENGKYGILLKKNTDIELTKEINRLTKNPLFRIRLQNLSNKKISQYDSSALWQRFYRLFTAKSQ